ncbi:MULTISPECIES: hypothetical protein [Fibrobacter]|uniref:hypothetical protein n=1 Tax=Fibrobacter TaxID=832 RepID=UPI000B5271C2|nr:MULTISPECIES: hypothetical protein [Fibrobacter]MBO4828236.1 hypothetical protein [Fibrobacter sp.]OWV17255.1 hypothetical protein B7990_10510 [Fibrobacter sp. UWB4]
MTENNNINNNENDDLNEVKKHATMTFAAIERSFNRMAYRRRNTIRIIVCLLFFFLGYQANNWFSSKIPTEKIIEKIAAQPDLPNKCKYRYDRSMEYAIMHECVFSHDTPTNEVKLIQRINYCSCALERVQKKKPFQKMFENNLEDFTFKIREEILCKDEKIPQALEMESETPTK